MLLCKGRRTRDFLTRERTVHVSRVVALLPTSSTVSLRRQRPCRSFISDRGSSSTSFTPTITTPWYRYLHRVRKLSLAGPPAVA
jgi:hypothetical protein